MRAARHLTAAGLALVLGTGLLAGCRTGADTEPADDPQTAAGEDTPGATAPSTAGPTEPGEPSEPTESPTPAVNGPNSITTPLAGAEVTGPVVTVTGEGTGFEGTLLYRVTRAGRSDVVAEGFTTAGANGEVGPYTVDLRLDAGEYTVQVWEPGMGEGDAGGEPRNLVEVTFTVS